MCDVRSLFSHFWQISEIFKFLTIFYSFYPSLSVSTPLGSVGGQSADSSKCRLAPKNIKREPMAAKASSPMTESRCRSLNKLLPDLEKKLIVDNIQSHLHVDAGGFLNEVEIIEVFSGRSRVEHVRSLFTVLKTKDNAAFGSFCLILSNSGYGHWSKALMEEAGLDHDFKSMIHYMSHAWTYCVKVYIRI